MQMQVILFQDVKGLGSQGDTVKVADGYFRNYLKPKGLADEANQANSRKYDKQKKRQLELAAEQEAEARILAKKLEDVTITIRAKAGEGDKLFGSVTHQDIADALEAQGYVVDRKHIEIDEHIKKLGMFTVGIRLHPQVAGKIRLLIERE
jgi:large subunit ribosomal protein L9